MSENVPEIKPVTIKIQKNYGISHALKKLVEEQKMELTDGKITASEWNAVLDKLIEIQQNRKANGQASIFSGGTDKTKAGWHSSFVVHPDQEIQFTAEEIGSLYEAMGAKFTAQSTPLEPDKGKADPADKGKADPADKGKADPVNTPTEIEGPNGTVIKDGKYYSKDGTQLVPEYAKGTEMKFESGVSARVWENGEKAVFRDEAGKQMKPADFMNKYPTEYTNIIAQQFVNMAGEETIKDLQVQFNTQDGKIVSADFTLNGKKVNGKAPISVKLVAEKLGIQPKQKETEPPAASQTEVTEGVTEEKRTNKYGREYTAQIKDGKEKTAIYYKADGKTIDYRYDYEYDSAGNMTKETETRGDGTLSYVSTYENGKEKRSTYYKADGKTIDYIYDYEYDSAGNKTKATKTQGDGTLGFVRTYENGKEKRSTYYKADGKTVDDIYDYEYDSAGNMTKATRTRGDGTLGFVWTYENGKEKRRTYYQADGKTIDYRYDYEYDSAGNKIKGTRTRGDGTLGYVSTYENGNEKRSTYYQADGKTPYKIVEDGQLKMVRILSIENDKKMINHKYEFDNDGVCTSSTLAEAIKNKISGPSFNKNTIKILSQLNTNNITKVLTSYQKLTGVTLQEDIADEWGLNDEDIQLNGKQIKVKDLITQLVAQRAQELDIKPDENGKYNLEELVKADTANS